MNRSELLSTFFPTWLWQGRQWIKGKVPKHDPYYWLNAHSHPVISTYYPPGIISSILGAVLTIDMAFLVLVASLGLHVLFGGIGWFVLFKSWPYQTVPVALFGAITMTLAGYQWKQQPCFQYTVAWFPWMLYGIATNNPLIAGLSLGMTLLAGYYPIGIQCIAISIGATILWHRSVAWIPIGVLIGLVQIIPFIKYLPRTIRASGHDDIGKVPFWHPITLVMPKAFRYNLNGVGYWEMSYYIGLAPLLVIWHTTSAAWMLLVISYALMVGVFGQHLPRIPARWSYAFQFSLIWLAVNGLWNMCLTDTAAYALCGLQLADLLINNGPLLVTRPYSELPQRPSRAFNRPLTDCLKASTGRVSGLPYPLFTGHVNEIKTIGYSGGMQLKLMAKWRGDQNSNGSGEHDYFKRHEDGEPVDRARIQFAYTRKKLDWDVSPVRNLFKNRRFSGC